MSATKSRIGRCRHCGKTAWRSYKAARGAVGRLDDDGRPCWHPQAGGYCITRSSQGEYDARRGAGIWTEEEL